MDALTSPFCVSPDAESVGRRVTSGRAWLIAVHKPGRIELLHTLHPHQRERAVELGAEDAQHVEHALLTTDDQAVDLRPADQDRAGSQSERLDHIGAAT